MNVNLETVKLLAKSKVTKIGAGAVSGAGIITIVFNLYSGLNARVDMVIKDQKQYTREHVKLKIDVVNKDIVHLKGGQTDMKKMLKTIHDHLIKKGL